MADMRKAFLADIIENIDDDTPRLIFADWLEDQGDAARAEFIRLQCQRAAEEGWPKPWLDWDRDTSLAPREAELIAEHGAEWRKEAPKWATKKFCYRRGFIGRVGATGPEWLTGVAGLYRRSPVEGLELRTGDDEQLDRLAPLSRWKYLRLLNFYTFDKSTKALCRFFASADLGRLVTLDYRYDKAGGDALEPILASDRLSSVRCLHLRGGSLGILTAAQFARAPLLLGTRSLGMYGGAAGVSAVGELVHRPGVSGLEELTLWSDEPGRLLIALAASPYLSNLRRLHVGHCPIPERAIHALATSPHLTKLTELSLHTVTESDLLEEYISESETLIHLRHLQLNNGIERHRILARLDERRRERGIE